MLMLFGVVHDDGNANTDAGDAVQEAREGSCSCLG